MLDTGGIDTRRDRDDTPAADVPRMRRTDTRPTYAVCERAVRAPRAARPSPPSVHAGGATAGGDVPATLGTRSVDDGLVSMIPGTRSADDGSVSERPESTLTYTDRVPSRGIAALFADDAAMRPRGPEAAHGRDPSETVSSHAGDYGGVEQEGPHAGDRADSGTAATDAEPIAADPGGPSPDRGDRVDDRLRSADMACCPARDRGRGPHHQHHHDEEDDPNAYDYDYDDHRDDYDYDIGGGGGGRDDDQDGGGDENGPLEESMPATAVAPLLSEDTLRPADCVDASRVLRALYLGSYHNAALCRDGLRAMGVTHVLTVGCDMRQPHDDAFRYHLVVLPDAPDAPIARHFGECIAFIGAALREPRGRVLVHCYAGVSRSATVVMAYLMATAGMTYPEAHEHVRKARHFVCPNHGFRRQLREFAARCGHAADRGPEAADAALRYERAAGTLRNMYRARRLSWRRASGVVAAFERAFGAHHPHCVDVKLEMYAFLSPLPPPPPPPPVAPLPLEGRSDASATTPSKDVRGAAARGRVVRRHRPAPAARRLVACV